MNREKSSLTIAYIGFLIVSALVYVASMVLDFEYEVWNKIVAAATVASYCFSITGFFKAEVTICKSIIIGCENLLPLSAEQDKLFEKTREKIREKAHFSKYDDKTGARYTSIVDIIKNMISSNSDKIKRTEKYIFVVNALGYLLFFCIVAFEGIYNGISNAQDFLTLLAFIAMLISDYISEYISDKYSERFEELCSQTQKNLDTLKDTYYVVNDKEYEKE